MRQYLDAVQEVLEVGTRKENRTGVDTLSTFNISYEIDLVEGFPLLTTKRVNWNHIVLENMWFLSGDPDIGLLRKHGIRFWDPWADEDGHVPSVYGNFWRRFPVHGPEIWTQHHDEDIPSYYNDQIGWVIDEIKRNPMSRRLVVSAWAPGNAQTSALPPCHLLFIFNVQVPHASICSMHRDADYANCDICRAHLRLNLHLTQRSCDMALGVPYNIAGYAFLLSTVAHLTGLRPGIFAHTLVDAHVYTKKEDGSMEEYDHIPRLREQLTREPRALPILKISDEIRTLEDIESLFQEDTETVMSKFVLEGYDPHPALRFKVAV